MHLQGQPLALAAVLPEGRDHALELVARLIDCHEAVGPLADPGRRLHADRGSDDQRRLGGRVQSRARSTRTKPS